MLEGAKYPEEVSKLEYALQQGVKPVVMAKAPTQAPVSVSSLNYGTEKSKLENVSQPHVKPVGSSQKTISAPTSASSLNLKLLLLVLVIASLLGSFTTIMSQKLGEAGLLPEPFYPLNILGLNELLLGVMKGIL